MNSVKQSRELFNERKKNLYIGIKKVENFVKVSVFTVGNLQK